MKCLICHQEERIIGYERDDPILGCGHQQASDPDDLVAEIAVYEVNLDVARIMKEKGVSRDEAMELSTREAVARASRQAVVSVLRVFSEAGLTCGLLEETKAKLSKSSQRYINSHRPKPA